MLYIYNTYMGRGEDEDRTLKLSGEVRKSDQEGVTGSDWASIQELIEKNKTKYT